MINALNLNNQILALDTPFNCEMLKNRNNVLFKKNVISISKCIIYFEKNYFKIKKENSEYKLPKKYDWNKICNQYTNLFYRLVN